MPLLTPLVELLWGCSNAGVGRELRGRVGVQVVRCTWRSFSISTTFRKYCPSLRRLFAHGRQISFPCSWGEVHCLIVIGRSLRPVPGGCPKRQGFS